MFRSGQKVRCIDDVKETALGNRKILVTKGRHYSVVRCSGPSDFKNMVYVTNDDGNEVPYADRRFVNGNEWKGRKR